MSFVIILKIFIYLKLTGQIEDINLSAYLSLKLQNREYIIMDLNLFFLMSECLVMLFLTVFFLIIIYLEKFKKSDLRIILFVCNIANIIISFTITMAYTNNMLLMFLSFYSIVFLLLIICFAIARNNLFGIELPNYFKNTKILIHIKCICIGFIINLSCLIYIY